MQITVNSSLKKKKLRGIRPETATNALLEIDVLGSVAKLKAAMSDLDTIFVSRSEEIQIISLALAMGQHILFEGKHGVAKSDIAREAFRRVTNAQVYDKMFSKGTMPDDVFGPTLMESYKAGKWEHNTEGALPEAHLANLEELGRASDLLLPTMMTLLNERIFHNGNQVIKCPLICAIGTTNFMSDSDELKAFIDRWMARVYVKPLASQQKQVEMLVRSLQPRPEVTNTVSLNEVRAINLAVQNIKADKDVVSTYVDIVSQYKKAANVDYLSDRRLVLAFRFAKAQAVLQGTEKVEVEHLDAVKYGIMFTGHDAEDAFASVMQHTVGNLAAMRKENEVLDKLEAYVRKLEHDYDPSLPQKEMRELLAAANKVTNGIANRKDPIIKPENQERMNGVVATAERLADEINKTLGK